MTENNFNVVIADDDCDDQLLLRQAIRELNAEFKVKSVYNGFQLLDLLMGRKEFEGNGVLPDYILLDINMPLLNGFGALAEMKKTDPLKRIPVFILSTSHSKADLLMARQLGADGFYTKPVDYCQLKLILNEIFSYPAIIH